MKVRAFYPVTLVIDGEEIILRIKRMDVEEASDFSTQLRRAGTPTYDRFVSRASSGPEQEKNAKGEYVISFEKIKENWIENMNAEKRAEYESAVDADEAKAKEFLIFVYEQFVTVERGLTEELPDGSEVSVSSGLDFLRIFAARNDVMQQVLETVRCENVLDKDQKKAWRSPAASSRFSTGRRRGRAGRKRGTTAELAATGDSAGNGGVKATRSNTSGLTATLPSSPVPSLD